MERSFIHYTCRSLLLSEILSEVKQEQPEQGGIPHQQQQQEHHHQPQQGQQQPHQGEEEGEDTKERSASGMAFHTNTAAAADAEGLQYRLQGTFTRYKL